MFKKISTGLLIVILAVLLGLYFIVRFSGQKERTFREQVLSFDPRAVTGLMINNPATNEPVELKLTGSDWSVISGGKTYRADSTVVKGMIRQLSDMPAKRYAGKGEEAWEKYELKEDMATRVSIFAGAKKISEILIGKFSYSMPRDDQQTMAMRSQGDMTTFVRLAGEREVYGVEGFLRMIFNRGAEEFRNKAISMVPPDDITRFTLTDGGQARILEKTDGQWYLDGAAADSMKAVAYGAYLSRLSGVSFIDADLTQIPPSHTVVMEGNNFRPITFKAYPIADTNVNYAVTSSWNPEAIFNGKERNLFEKIFLEWNHY